MGLVFSVLSAVAFLDFPVKISRWGTSEEILEKRTKLISLNFMFEFHVGGLWRGYGADLFMLVLATKGKKKTDMARLWRNVKT